MTNLNDCSEWRGSVLLDDETFNYFLKDNKDHHSLLDELQKQKLSPFNHSDQDNSLNSNQGLFYQQYDAIPINEEFPGHLNFKITLPDPNTPKHLTYSSKLDKVYTNMEQTLPIRFKWEPPLDGLYLRTSMVFSLDQYRNDPVQRCHNHMAESNHSNQGICPRIIKHVVRCSDPLSIYEENNGHLSILTPLRTPQVGSQYVQLFFQFFCKNSCTSGMNRRPTELLFTLEDQMNKVIGRRRLKVRVCSCPKRDKEKEEADAANNTIPNKKKRTVTSNKKVILPSCDTHVYDVQLRVVGKENYLAVMKYAHDVMAGQASRTGQFEFFKPYMENILHKMP